MHKITVSQSSSATLSRKPSTRKDRYEQYNIVHKASMQHRNIMLDSNDTGNAGKSIFWPMDLCQNSIPTCSYIVLIKHRCKDNNNN